MEAKECTKCGQTKPLTEFFRNRCNGPEARRSDCKSCNQAKYADWSRRNPIKRRAIDRKHKYGITQEQFEALFKSQDGACAICLTKDDFGRGAIHVDHDHKTGGVRGLLCVRCNAGLGYFRDDPDLLLKSVEYLRRLV